MDNQRNHPYRNYKNVSGHIVKEPSLFDRVTCFLEFHDFQATDEVLEFKSYFQEERLEHKRITDFVIKESIARNLKAFVTVSGIEYHLQCVCSCGEKLWKKKDGYVSFL